MTVLRVRRLWNVTGEAVGQGLSRGLGDGGLY